MLRVRFAALALLVCAFTPSVAQVGPPPPPPPGPPGPPNLSPPGPNQQGRGDNPARRDQRRDGDRRDASGDAGLFDFMAREGTTVPASLDDPVLGYGNEALWDKVNPG